MKTYSLPCPTRKRPSFLKAYLDSLAETTAHPERIEVLVAYDNDDVETKERFNSGLITKYKFVIKPLERARSNFLNEDYYNWMARQTTSDYIFVNADDLRFIVPGWDKIIESKVEMYCNDKPDRIIGVGVKDNTPKPKPNLPQFPCFPLITKETMKYWDFVLHGFVPTWGADYLFYLLYHGAGRYLPIDDRVYMNHIGVHTHTGPKDETAAHIERVFNALKMNPKHHIETHRDTTIPNQATQLRNHIRSR